MVTLIHTYTYTMKESQSSLTSGFIQHYSIDVE